MNRRGFLVGMLAAGAAPAICKAENLMKIIVPSKGIILRQIEFSEVFFSTIVVESDISAVLVEKIRDVAWNTYRQAAYGDVNSLIVTDPRTIERANRSFNRSLTSRMYRV